MMSRNLQVVLSSTVALACVDSGAIAQSVDDLPEQMELVAVVRDFRSAEDHGGHPDFQSFSGHTRVGLVEEYIGADGKPVLKSLTGHRIGDEFRDSEGRAINPAMYDADRGDVAGTLEARDDVRITSADSFKQWYHDVPGVNMSSAVTLTLTRTPGTDVYVFDSDEDPLYRSLGGFFPLNDKLFGNYASTGSNFHFTTELDTRFTFSEGSGYVFKFTGDDDVWVFIDGRLVIDLGSLHSREEQYLEIDRLDWLVDGEEYSLKVFHAERRTSQSNFRIETTLPLKSVNAVTVNDNFD